MFKGIGRTGVVLSVFLMGCGGGGGGGGGRGQPAGGGGGGGSPCGGGCDPGFVCNTGAGGCTLDPSGLWVLTLTTGTVAERQQNGDSWDLTDAYPDPYVYLTINGDRRCSSVKQDTPTPSWYESFPAQTATGLLGGVKVEYADKHLISDNPICGTAVVEVAISNFQSGRWGAQCPSGSISATLAIK